MTIIHVQMYERDFTTRRRLKEEVKTRTVDKWDDTSDLDDNHDRQL